jgi:hypothetical protein
MMGQDMVYRLRGSDVRSVGAWWVGSAVMLFLAGCSETVWVKPDATAAESETAIEQCLSQAYLQAPSAPATRTLGSDVAAPSFTTCSGLGFSGACITSRGQ